MSTGSAQSICRLENFPSKEKSSSSQSDVKAGNRVLTLDHRVKIFPKDIYGFSYPTVGLKEGTDRLYIRYLGLDNDLWA